MTVKDGTWDVCYVVLCMKARRFLGPDLSEVPESQPYQKKFGWRASVLAIPTISYPSCSAEHGTGTVTGTSSLTLKT